MHYLRTHWWLLLVFAIASFTMLWRLDAQPYVNFDEGIHGEVSWEMVESGSWLTPQYTGGPYFRKPPLKLWISAALFDVFGVNSWTLRLPSALAGIATALLVAVWAAQLTRSRTAGALAGVIIATVPAIHYHAFRTGEMDGLLTFFVTAALYCWWRFGKIRNPKSEIRNKHEIRNPKQARMTTILITETVSAVPFRAFDHLGFGFVSDFVLRISRCTWWLTLCGVAIGLAVMTKSAAGLLPLPIIALDWFIHRRTIRIPLRDILVLVLVLVLVSLPWHLAMSFLHGAAFWNEYLGFHIVRRITEQLHNETAGAWWYFPIAAKRWWPYTPWLLAALAFLAARIVTRRTPMNDRGAALPVLWLSIGFALLTLTKTKFDWYLLPMLPACAMLIAGFTHTILWRSNPRKHMYTLLDGRPKVCTFVRWALVVLVVMTVGAAGARTYARLTASYLPSPFTAIADAVRGTGGVLVAYGFDLKHEPAGYFILRTTLADDVRILDGKSDPARARGMLATPDRRAFLVTRSDAELPEELRAMIDAPRQFGDWSLAERAAP